MNQSSDIVSLAYRQPYLLQDLELLQEVERSVPGSVRYSIRRYHKQPGRSFDDTGMVSYHFNESAPSENFLQLSFCITGNMYCREKKTECDHCKLNETASCSEKTESMDVLHFRFHPSYLKQFTRPRKDNTDLSDSILDFSHQVSFSRALPICGKTRSTIEAMLNHHYTDSFANIFINAQTQILLLYSLDCMADDKDDLPVKCKFLANEEDREKIIKARELLLQHIGDPITIKALSRKVAINECYLKKGFREIFGTTIFDFYQGQRMEHAKYLLYEKGLSVTEVSMLLGYSSISHFSTAFKKHTGIKPCELLMPR
jgi:AraC-like DNA-binding protein